MPDKFGGETVDEITRRWRQDHPVNGAGREPKQRFELTRFNAVLRSSSAAYLVKGLIPRGGLTVVWGPPKCGKSFWTFDLAMHVARGEPYRDRRVHQGAVVYLALEGGHGFRARIDAFRREHHVDDAPFYLMTDRTDLVKDHEALIIAIRAQIGAETPALVVVDTLNRSLAGSESKDEDMAAYIRAADAIREAFECSVVIVHHCGIDGTRPRGHTSLTGAADAQHAVSRDASDNIVVTVEWMKMLWGKRRGCGTFGAVQQTDGAPHVATF
jgi:RecA-family ATPase